MALCLQRVVGATDPLSFEHIVSAIEQGPVTYQALRRLDGASASLKESAWLEAFTEYTAASGFEYRILAAGGSARIMNRGLKAVLEAERENAVEWRKSALTRENYDFALQGESPDGLVQVKLTPRRRDPKLVDGVAWVSPVTGQLVRVEGRLSKSPSFWVRWVNVTRSYIRIRGAAMPSAVESTADIRVAGLSTFSMTYRYAMVDGQRITPPKLAF